MTMNNKIKLGGSFLSLMALLFVSSCCTKTGCLGQYYKEVKIVFVGYNKAELDSSSLKEYDKNSNRVLYSAAVNNSRYSDGYLVHLGSQFLSFAQGKDSFYLDQRYFVLSLMGQKDTIRDISYQSYLHSSDCSNCGKKDFITDVSNFSCSFRGRTYTDADTIYVVK